MAWYFCKKNHIEVEWSLNICKSIPWYYENLILYYNFEIDIVYYNEMFISHIWYTGIWFSYKFLAGVVEIGQ